MTQRISEEEILKQLDLRVKDVMQAEPLTVPAEATVIQAAKAMEEQDSSVVLAQSKGQVVGIVTERDITRRAVARGANLDKTLVSAVMTSPIIAVSADARIEEALKMMTSKRVRRLPVLDEKNGIAGIVAVVDIARALAEKAGYTSSLITAMTKERTPPRGVYE
jgi:signal-transduction protein with cAMP-binding, CBS, and nucleotidyltransferase domain